MFNLPAELALNILSYLPFPSLNRLQSVSKSWNEFCNLHENTIYRNAAYLNRYIPCPTTMLNELGSFYSERVLENVNTWKDLGRKRLEIQRNWKGKGPSTLVEYRSTSLDWTHMVHRIKVDELAGYIMTTSTEGGLLVTHIDEDRLLWALPPWYVRPYAHLEYEQGYIIFDRTDGDKEVWKRLSDIPEHVVDGSSAPDVVQSEIYGQISESRPSSNDVHFQPWAVLHMSEHTSAFRFVYPTLIVAAHDRAYLWDIPSGKLIQTLQEFQLVTAEDGHNEYLGRIKYVEISERHVFLMGRSYLRVFSRATSKSILDLSGSKWRYGFWIYTPTVPQARIPDSALVRYQMQSTQAPYGSKKWVVDGEFVAVHVSACGCHFAALLGGSRLLIVYDFEKVSNERELYAQTLDIQIASSQLYISVYLAFDYGRISVATTGGVFIIEVDESTVGNILNEAPTLTLCRVCRLTNEVSLDYVSCLMISDTGLYLNYHPATLEDEDEEETLEPWSQDDLQNGNLMVAELLAELIPQSSSSLVFSVNFACC